MKKVLFAVTLFALLFMVSRQATAKTREVDSLSYVIGIDMGYNFQRQNFNLRTSDLAAGMESVFQGDPTTMSREQSHEWLHHYFSVVYPAKNKVESEAWLSEVEKEPGVRKTESGLLYRVDDPGDESVMATSDSDVVHVKYTGWSHRGTEFENDQDGVEINLSNVINGWKEGMKLVGKGGRITLWIPSELAYGEHGNFAIPGNEALKFEVELLDVNTTTPYDGDPYDTVCDVCECGIGECDCKLRECTCYCELEECECEYGFGPEGCECRKSADEDLLMEEDEDVEIVLDEKALAKQEKLARKMSKKRGKWLRQMEKLDRKFERSDEQYGHLFYGN